MYIYIYERVCILLLHEPTRRFVWSYSSTYQKKGRKTWTSTSDTCKRGRECGHAVSMVYVSPVQVSALQPHEHRNATTSDTCRWLGVHFGRYSMMDQRWLSVSDGLTIDWLLDQLQAPTFLSTANLRFFKRWLYTVPSSFKAAHLWTVTLHTSFQGQYDDWNNCPIYSCFHRCYYIIQVQKIKNLRRWNAGIQPTQPQPVQYRNAGPPPGVV